MTRRVPWWGWLIVAVLLVLAARFVLHFPWRETGQALAGASLPILCVAALVNLSSFVAKGTAWHLLLRPVAPHRWRTAMSATLIGAAVNNLGVAVSGEAARIHVIMQRDGVPLKAAVSSVMWSRVVEGIGLALFVVLGAWAMPLPSWVRPVQIGLMAGLLALIVITRAGGWHRMLGWLPEQVRRLLDSIVEIAARGRLSIPVLLGIANWVAEWGTYHLSMVAVCGPVSIAASFLALLAANIGGIPRLTPGNVGIMQASFVLGLAPFGITADRAIAAGLVSQAIQVLPVLLAGSLAAGATGLRATVAASTEVGAES